MLTDGAWTTSSGSEFQKFTTIIPKEFARNAVLQSHFRNFSELPLIAIPDLLSKGSSSEQSTL